MGWLKSAVNRGRWMSSLFFMFPLWLRRAETLLVGCSAAFNQHVPSGIAARSCASGRPTAVGPGPDGAAAVAMKPFNGECPPFFRRNPVWNLVGRKSRSILSSQEIATRAFLQILQAVGGFAGGNRKWKIALVASYSIHLVHACIFVFAIRTSRSEFFPRLNVSVRPAI